MELQLQHISKSFPGVQALDAVDLVVQPGRVHAICGENGAGKSTLLNIMTGNLQPDRGKLLVNGEPRCFPSPREAFSCGIAIVYQHLSLIDFLSIAENIYANFPATNRYGFLRKKWMERRADDLLEKLQLHGLKASQPVHSLSAGQKQMIEIAKALAKDPQLILFDEPTASLSEKDVGVIFRIIRQLQQENRAIVYISHRLKEVLSIADTITVLKDGQGQGSYPAAVLDRDRLIRLMVGREIIEPDKQKPPKGAPLLEVDQLRGKGFQDIRFTLNQGEVLGLAGLVGSGRTEIAKAIFGAAGAKGQLKLRGKNIQLFRHPRQAIEQGIAYLPEDRKWQGIFGDKSVAENIYVTQLALRKRFKLKVLERAATALCESFRVRTPSVRKRAAELSGGNQQKLLLARWLSIDPEIVLLDEPTQGIDIGAKNEIYHEIRRLAEAGKGIILISSELVELLQLCDRIIVLKEGKIAGEVSAAEATEQKIISLAIR